MRFGVIAGVAAALIAGTATAQESTTEAAEAEAPRERVMNGQPFGAWAVACEAIAVGETACMLSQRLVQSSNDTFLAELLAFWNPDGTQAFVSARVPNGVFFPSGLAMRPDGAEDDSAQIEFAWQSCTAQLCEALVELDVDAMSDFEGEGAMVAGYRPSVTAEPLVFRVNVAGLEDGLMALRP